MSDLKTQLIKLGSMNPKLRPHIREVLSSIEHQKVLTSSKKVRLGNFEVGNQFVHQGKRWKVLKYHGARVEVIAQDAASLSDTTIFPDSIMVEPLNRWDGVGRKDPKETRYKNILFEIKNTIEYFAPQGSLRFDVFPMAYEARIDISRLEYGLEQANDLDLAEDVLELMQKLHKVVKSAKSALGVQRGSITDIELSRHTEEGKKNQDALRPFSNKAVRILNEFESLLKGHGISRVFIYTP